MARGARGATMRSTALMLVVAMCWVFACEAAVPKKSEEKGLMEHWKSANKKEIATDVLSTFVIYEGLTVGWMISTWVLAWVIQPTKLGLVKQLARCFPGPHSAEHGPHNKLVHEGGFVDTVTTSFKYHETRAEHALEFVSNALPLNLRHLAFSYAESAIFRKFVVYFTAPGRLFLSVKILEQLKENRKQKK